MTEEIGEDRGRGRGVHIECGVSRLDHFVLCSSILSYVSAIATIVAFLLTFYIAVYVISVMIVRQADNVCHSWLFNTMFSLSHWMARWM